MTQSQVHHLESRRFVPYECGRKHLPGPGEQGTPSLRGLLEFLSRSGGCRARQLLDSRVRCHAFFGRLGDT